MPSRYPIRNKQTIDAQSHFTENGLPECKKRRPLGAQAFHRDSQNNGPRWHLAAHRKASAGAPRESAGSRTRLGHLEDETGQLLCAQRPLPEIPTDYPVIIISHQVNRRFRDFVQASPYTQYRIDLLAVGLEDNPAAHRSLFDKQRALDEYRIKWDAFSPIQQRERKIEGFSCHSPQASNSGVCAFAVGRWDKAIQFVTLESISRGIPRKEWKVPLPPDLSLQQFAFNNHANVLVLVGRQAT